jgi:epoxyqueuosine reductase QueG
MTDEVDSRLTEEVARLARAAGARLVGFADLQGLARLPRGVVVAMGHSPAVLADPTNMPNEPYSREYAALNERLTDLAGRIAAMLQASGHTAAANQATRHQIDPERLAAGFPHKTAATRAGLGWIGKSALLVTEELGPALRLASVLTDAPLAVGEPVADSSCGDCTICVEACPAGAIKGEHWYAGRPREEFYDAHGCHRMCDERSRAAGITQGGRCGICMAICPRRPRD